MGEITWVEDAKTYVYDIIVRLRELGHKVTVVKTCSVLLKRLPKVSRTSKVIILDLWLPPGDDIDLIPNSLLTKNTERGLWLVDRVREAVLQTESEAHIVVLSGNLDVDTQQHLIEKDFSKDFIWKKPAEFAQFVRFVHRMAQGESESDG